MAQHQAAIYRNEIVSPISRFYTFLATNARIVASAIEIPPPGGWPEDYRGVWRSMGKSDEVLDVLSHLPYIDGTAWLWDHETKPINYVDELILRRLNGDYAKCRYLFEPDQHGDGIGEHVVSLTNGRLYYH